ncbi:transposase [Clostridium estertheticum]|uniref:transposase n=1 Tax=Clostridium estertheticum TaxID=238834 RepID=UPI001CCB1140|nr:transposase [Clostridium estertheticum]MBZ9607337.1 transposase [Clostridium estertheticum]
MKYLKPKVIIDVVKMESSNVATKSPIQNKKVTLEEKIMKAIQLLHDGIGKSQICKQLNMDIRVFDKLLSMNDNERSFYLKSPLQISHEGKVAKKNEIINIARDMHNNNHSVRSIAIELGMSRKTITKYLDDNVSAINGNYNVKRKSILDPFLEEINKLIDKGHTSSDIENVIRQKGYNGSDSTIRNYRSRLKKSIHETYKNSKTSPATTDLVDRGQLLKLLYKPLIKVKRLSIDYVNKVNEKYPLYKEIIDLVGEFRKILKNKEISKISKWMEQASSLNNKYINSFINGITRDISAVKNAIIYDYNNGLAEGSVNKLKVIKRIMYGRNSFEMLYKKILWLEKRRKIN